MGVCPWCVFVFPLLNNPNLKVKINVIFSREDAAQQVLMSVRPSVCGQPEIPSVCIPYKSVQACSYKRMHAVT